MVICFCKNGRNVETQYIASLRKNLIGFLKNGRNVETQCVASVRKIYLIFTEKSLNLLLKGNYTF